MEGRKQVLLLWLSKVAKQRIPSANSLRNGNLLEKILAEIEGFSFGKVEQGDDWKINYKRLKSIYEQLDNYIKTYIKKIPQCSFDTLNFVEMAKGQSEDGLETILNLIFVVCLNSSNKETYINCIMELPISSQETIMKIIQESQITINEEKEEPSEIEYYKQELRKIQYQCQSLLSQNMSLRTAMDQDSETLKKNEELLKKYQKENTSLMRQLQQKNEFIRMRQDTFLDKYSENNQELVEDLKKSLLEREQYYSTEIFNLKEINYNLNESIVELKRSNNDFLEDQSRRSLMQSRDEHINCIPLEKHKLKINQMMANTKEATQKELQSKLENIKLKNTMAQAQSKNKKLMESLRQKEQDMMISNEDGQKLKIEFFSRVRDALKQKLESYQSERFKKHPQSRLDDFLNDDN